MASDIASLGYFFFTRLPQALWRSSLRRQHQIPTRPIRVGSASVQPVATVRNLGVYLDADATMRAHVTSTVRACFAILRQINSVRHRIVCTCYQ